MNHKKQLSKVVESLIEGEGDRASKLLHSVLVEKSRSIFDNLLNEEEDDAFEMNSTEDFVDDIESDMDEIDDDEMDGEVEDEEDEEMLDDEDGMDMGDEADEPADDDVEQRLDDVESSLSELNAEFDALLADELENEEHHDDLASDLGLEDEDEGEDDEFDVEFGMEDGEGDLDTEEDMEMDMEGEEEDMEDEDEDELEESYDYDAELREISEAIDDLIDGGASSRYKDETRSVSSPVSMEAPKDAVADGVEFGGGNEKGEKYDKDGSLGDEYHESNYESHLDSSPVSAKEEDGDNVKSPIGSEKLKESRRKKRRS